MADNRCENCAGIDSEDLRPLDLIDERDVCVCDFVEILGQRQPQICEGKWVHFGIAPPVHAGVAQILGETVGVLQRQGAMQTDRSRLEKGELRTAEVWIA